MIKRVAILLLAAVIFAGYSVSAEGRAAVSYHNPIAYIGADGSLYMTSLDQKKSTLMMYQGTAAALGNIRWSPTGSRFVVTAFHRSGNTFYIIESGKFPRLLSQHEISQPALATWSPDGTQLAYLTGDFPRLEVEVASVTKDSSATIIDFVTLCSIDLFGRLLPEDYMLASERGGKDMLYVPYIYWTPYGILVGADCGDSPAMIAPNGKTLWTLRGKYGAPQRHQAVSSDGSAALFDNEPFDNSIFSIDLATGKPTQLDSLKGVEPLGWTSDGSGIFYATFSDIVNVTTAYERPDPSTEIFGFYPVYASRETITLWQADSDGKAKPRQLFQGEGTGFGRFAVLPDNSAVIFSIVTSSARRVEALNAGKRLSQVRAIPEASVELFAAPLKDGLDDPILLTRNGIQFGVGSGTFEISGVTSAK